MKHRHVLKNPILLLLAGVIAAAEPHVYESAVEKIYRIELDKGDLLLESLQAVIQKESIRDGVLLSAAGSLSECTFHGVGGKKTTLAEDMEINHLGGIIAGGEPHFHVALTNAKRGGFGGHLENGCKVLSHVEVSIAKLSGPALVRRKGSLEPK